MAAALQRDAGQTGNQRGQSLHTRDTSSTFQLSYWDIPPVDIFNETSGHFPVGFVETEPGVLLRNMMIPSTNQVVLCLNICRPESDHVSIKTEHKENICKNIT